MLGLRLLCLQRLSLYQLFVRPYFDVEIMFAKAQASFSRCIFPAKVHRYVVKY